MAEFCLDCWLKLNGTAATERDYILSRDFDLCENCGEFRRVIERARTFKFFCDLHQTLKSKTRR